MSVEHALCFVITVLSVGILKMSFEERCLILVEIFSFDFV